MGRKDHRGGDTVGRPQTLDNQGTVIKRRERWLQGHRIMPVLSNLPREVPLPSRNALGIDTTQERSHARGQPGTGHERKVDMLSQ